MAQCMALGLTFCPRDWQGIAFENARDQEPPQDGDIIVLPLLMGIFCDACWFKHVCSNPGDSLTISMAACATMDDISIARWQANGS